VRVVRRDGKAFYLMRVVPYRNAGPDCDGIVLTFTNLTLITGIEEFQREIRNRIEQMLDQLEWIAQDGVERGLASAVVQDRMVALANAYRLLLRADWAPVDLYAVASGELVRYGIGPEGRVAVSEAALRGPVVKLMPRAAVAIGKAFHELAAGAAMHRALSVPVGRVHLDWSVVQPGTQQARLLIRWRESNGPRVEGTQSVTGSEIIEAALAELDGTAALFGEDAASAELSMPLAAGVVLSGETDEQAAATLGTTAAVN
jgi:two-component sensor histidine kinase